MGTLAQIWRHPIKSHGRERIHSVALAAMKTMPWDRRWAVAHEAAKTNGSDWAECVNFSRGSKVSELMAISATADEAAGTVTLEHPRNGTLTLNPDTEADAFLAWVKPLMPENRAQSAQIVRVPDRGMTDTPYPSISLLSFNSLADLGRAMDADVSMMRFRGNLWLDGFEPWEEFGWVGRELRIGTAEFTITAPIKRCRATTANPETGQYDLNTLATLNGTFGHQDFGVYATVSKGGLITETDEVVFL